MQVIEATDLDRKSGTGISYFALLATSTCAALRRESRMQVIEATVSTGNPGDRDFLLRAAGDVHVCGSP